MSSWIEQASWYSLQRYLRRENQYCTNDVNKRFGQKVDLRPISLLIEMFVFVMKRSLTLIVDLPLITDKI